MISTLAASPAIALHPLQRVRRLVSTRSVALSVLALIVGVWLLERLVIGEMIGGRRIGYLAFGALPNAVVVGRGSPGQWWRYMSDTLVHDAGTSLDLWVNGVMLVLFGGHVERLYGRRTCVAAIALAATAGGLAWLAWTELGFVAQPDYSSGASAAACGLIGMLLAFAWSGRGDLRPAEVGSIKTQAALGVALIALLGLAVPGLNNAAHAGGLAGGLALGLAVPPLPRWGGRRLRPAMDALLWGVVGLAGLSVLLAGINLSGRLLGH